VKVGIGASAGATGLLVEVGATIGGGDWAAASEVADGRLDVSPCWPHPHRDKPTSILAAVIRILRSELILFLPSFNPTLIFN